MRVNKVEKAVSYKDRVYSELKDAIIAHRLKPGEAINERMLAEEMGISRTPVREALQMLEKEGWILTEPWKGTYVLDMTEQDIQEVFNLRMVLEPLVLELIINKMDEKNGRIISDILQKQVESWKESGAQEFINIDRNFHMSLANLTGSKRLIQILSDLSDMMRRLGIEVMAQAGRHQEVLNEHMKVIEALLAKNLPAAKKAMLNHLEKTQDTFYKHRKQ